MTNVRDAAPVEMVTKTVLVCDQHPMIRWCLTAQFTGNRSSLRVICAVPGGRAAVDAFTTTPTDLVLIGVHRGASSGTAAVDMLSRAYPLAPIFVFGAAQDGAVLVAAVGLGACGLMLWDITDPLPRRVPVRSPRLPAPGDPPPPGVLTDFERTLLHRISEGETNAQIARRMGVPEQAVRTSRRSLFGKLGARDRAHAVALGLRLGLLT